MPVPGITPMLTLRLLHTHSNVAKERLSIILAHQRLADVDIQQLQVRPLPPHHHHRHKEGRGGGRRGEGKEKGELSHTHVITQKQADVLACVQKYVKITPEQAVSIKGTWVRERMERHK